MKTIYLAIEIKETFNGLCEHVLAAFDNYDEAEEFAIDVVCDKDLSTWNVREITYYHEGDE